MKSGGGGTEFPTLDEVLTWDSFDLTEETDDLSIEEGDGYQSENTPVSGLHGYMCALVSYVYSNDTPYGFTTFYLHNKELTESQSSKAAARAPGMEQVHTVDGNEVIIPVLMSNGSFRLALYQFLLQVSKTSGYAWITIGTVYEMTGGDAGNGEYSLGDFDYCLLKPVVYYKAF